MSTNLHNTTHSPASVGVVMRTKNRLLLLHRAFASVLLQTHTAWHLYLVNDGGDRAALEDMLAPYRPLFAGRLTVLHHTTSQGMEAASNAALAHLSEAFFVIHDDDDSWDPNFLKDTTSFLQKEQNLNFVAVTTGCIIVQEEIRNNQTLEISRTRWTVNTETVDFTKILYANIFPPISLLMRSSLLQSVGYYNANLPVLGDWEYNLRIMMQGDIGYIHTPLAFYHRRLPGTHSVYSNTITDQADTHHLQNTLMRNQWLRESLQHAPHMLGIMQGLLFSIRQHATYQTPPYAPHQDLLNIVTALQHINQRLDTIELTASWLHKLLRPIQKTWTCALPLRRVVARLRGRI